MGLFSHVGVLFYINAQNGQKKKNYLPKWANSAS